MDNNKQLDLELRKKRDELQKNFIKSIVSSFENIQEDLIKNLKNASKRGTKGNQALIKAIHGMVEDANDGILNLYTKVSDDRIKDIDNLIKDKSRHGSDIVYAKKLKAILSDDSDKIIDQLIQNVKNQGKTLVDELVRITGKDESVFSKKSQNELISLYKELYNKTVDTLDVFSNDKLREDFEEQIKEFEQMSVRDMGNGFKGFIDTSGKISKFLGYLTDKNGVGKLFDNDTLNHFSKQNESLEKIKNTYSNFQTTYDKHHSEILDSVNNDTMKTILSGFFDRHKNKINDMSSNSLQHDVFRQINKYGDLENKINDSLFTEIRTDTGYNAAMASIFTPSAWGKGKKENLENRKNIKDSVEKIFGISLGNDFLNASSATAASDIVGDTLSFKQAMSGLFGELFDEIKNIKDKNAFDIDLSEKGRNLSKVVNGGQEAYRRNLTNMLSGGDIQRATSGGGIFGAIGRVSTGLGALGVFMGKTLGPLVENQVISSRSGLGGTSLLSTGFFNSNSLDMSALLSGISSSSLREVSTGKAAQIARLGGIKNWANLLTNDSGMRYGQFGTNEDIMKINSTLFETFKHFNNNDTVTSTQMNYVRKMLSELNDNYGTMPDEIEKSFINAMTSDDVKNMYYRGFGPDQMMKLLKNISDNYGGKYTTAEQRSQLLNSQTSVMGANLSTSHEQAIAMASAANAVGKGHLIPILWDIYHKGKKTPEEVKQLDMIANEIVSGYRSFEANRGANDKGAFNTSGIIQGFISQNSLLKTKLDNPNLIDYESATQLQKDKTKKINDAGAVGSMGIFAKNLSNGAFGNDAIKWILGLAAAGASFATIKKLAMPYLRNIAKTKGVQAAQQQAAKLMTHIAKTKGVQAAQQQAAKLMTRMGITSAIETLGASAAAELALPLTAMAGTAYWIYDKDKDKEVQDHVRNRAINTLNSPTSSEYDKQNARKTLNFVNSEPDLFSDLASVLKELKDLISSDKGTTEKMYEDNKMKNVRNQTLSREQQMLNLTSSVF